MSHKHKEREFLVDCIEMYRRLPVLWQVKNKLYHDRDKKNAAYDVLLAKYNEMFPNANKEDLKKKINSLRTNYRKELKKYMDSMNNGASDDSIYVPTLWYFDEMNFLRDQELPLDMDVQKSVKKRPIIRSSIEDKQETLNGVTSPYTESKYTIKKTKTEGHVMDLAHDCTSEIKDEYHHWGMACAADLQKMEKNQQIYAKKAIAEILMEGQLGLLDRHSVKINENANFNSTVKLSASPSPQYSDCTTSPSCNDPTTVYVKSGKVNISRYLSKKT